MMQLLQKRENGKIVMCNLGNFYLAIGKDATLLVSGQQKDVLKPSKMRCKIKTSKF